MASLISAKNIDESSSIHDATTSSPSYVILDQPLSSGTRYYNYGYQPPEYIDDFPKQTTINMEETEEQSNSEESKESSSFSCYECCLCCGSFCEMLGAICSLFESCA